MLSAYRVLDLTDERGLIAGMVLADLGADVIQVEPPDGSRARQVGPFVAGRSDPESSLFWRAYARNKRGITLDLEGADGRAAFLRLVVHADCVLESYVPGYLAGLGLGYDDLAAVNPGVVLTSISPYGQTGPKANWPAVDLTVSAACGFLYMCGDADRAPLRITAPQGLLYGGLHGAAGTLVALHERRRSGRGQQVDVSAQQAASLCTTGNMLSRFWNDSPTSRAGDGIQAGPVHLRFIFPARDGFVSITFAFGNAMGPATRRLMEWVYEEGWCDAATRDKDWIGYGLQLISGQEPISELERVHATVAALTGSQTKRDLFAESRRRGVLLAPVATCADLRRDPHLEARDFWQPAEPDDAAIRYPGPFAKFSGTPLNYRRPAPRLGEHNAEIIGTMPVAQPRSAVTNGVVASAGEPALAGLKVLDLSWVGVGPQSIRALSDYGATVVRVESTARIDNIRTLSPMKDGIAGAERSAAFHNVNAGKLGIALNLSKPEARSVLVRLAQWADVLMESFTPKTMRNWSLDYEALRKLNPRLIYVSTSLGGQWGPYSQFAGYGNQGAAMAGFTNLIGWPDQARADPGGPYTDYVVPGFITCGILAALEERERTGRGQHIDVSQVEAPVHFLAPYLLDYEMNGHDPMPNGNRDPDMAPHGVFRCAGTDRWVAIGVQDGACWQALCAVMRRPDLAADPRYATLPGRKSAEDELEQQVEAWTVTQSAEAAQDQLVAAGVAAHVVANADDLYQDPQLRQRGHFVSVPHAELGDLTILDSRFRLSRTPAAITRAGPTYGQDAHRVLSEFLSLDADEITALAEAGALE